MKGDGGGGSELTELELLVLRSLRISDSIEALAKVAKLPSSTLGKEIARLQLGGYISDEGAVTEKAVRALGEEP